MRNAILLLVASMGLGCSGGGATDMMMMVGNCTDQSKDVMPFAGDAAGALALTTPAVKAWYSDAYLTEIHGGLVSVATGKTTAGLNGMGGQWVIDYYSPTAKHAFRGTFNITLGHVSCQDITIDPVPAAQPDPPKRKSTEVMMTAVTTANFQLPMRAQSVDYGRKNIGIGQAHDKAWLVDFATSAQTPYRVIIDDETGVALECDNNGTSCL